MHLTVCKLNLNKVDFKIKLYNILIYKCKIVHHQSETTPILLLDYPEFFFAVIDNVVMKILTDESLHISAVQNCLMDKTHPFSFTSHIFVENKLSLQYFHVLQAYFNKIMKRKLSQS